jgi:hypothetical protein
MRALIALACAAVLAGAEAPPPQGSPRDVDALTRRRAEEALAAHSAAIAPAAPVDPALLDRLASVSGVIQEGAALAAKGQMAEAGDRYLAASELVKAFTAEERHALGARWASLQAGYTALGRGLAESADPAPEATPPAPAQANPDHP